MSNKNQDNARRTETAVPRTSTPEAETTRREPNTGPAPRLDPWAGRPEWTPERGDDSAGLAHLVARYPLTSLVAGFGVGFSLGILAIAMLPREDRGWMERNHLRKSLHDLSSSLARLPSSLAQHLPEKWGG